MPYFRFAKAMAEYRAGRFEDALTLRQGDTQEALDPVPPLLLVMMQQCLGQADAAQASHQATVERFDWDPAKATNREA